LQAQDQTAIKVNNEDTRAVAHVIARDL